MKKILGVLAVFSLIVVLTSCSQQASRVPEGVWQLQSGDISFSYLGIGKLDYVSFSPAESTAQLFGHDEYVQLKGCSSAFVSTTDGLMVFWPASLGWCSAGSGSPQELSYAYRYETSGDTLTLTSSTGGTAVFKKVDEVPAASRCTAVEPLAVTPLELNVDMAYSSNMTSDGSQLWIAGENGKVYPIDPATGSVGVGQDLNAGQYYHIRASQGADFWADCRCGHNDDTRRVRIGGTVVDSIDTDTDLAHKISIRAAAWDGSRLWLGGYNWDTKKGELLVVDSNAEPDVLDKVYDFSMSSLRNMVYHDGALWGLFHFAGWQIATIDPVAGRVTQSYTLPALGIEDGYLGIASLGGKLYLLSEEGDGYKLIAVQP